MQIVTELALNGDLFKYIRTVPAPPLLAMVSLIRSQWDTRADESQAGADARLRQRIELSAYKKTTCRSSRYQEPQHPNLIKRNSENQRLWLSESVSRP